MSHNGFKVEDGSFVGFYDLIESNTYTFNPLFVNNENNFSLTPESPCIDAGNPGSNPDPDGTVADIGALYYDQNQRIFQGAWYKRRRTIMKMQI